MPMNQYIYNLITGNGCSRVRGGPRVISNGVPITAFGQCRVQVNWKRGIDVEASEDACSLAPQPLSSTKTAMSSISEPRTSSTLRKSILSGKSIIPDSHTSPPPASQHDSTRLGASISTANPSTTLPVSSSTPPSTPLTTVPALPTVSAPVPTITVPLVLACVLQ